MGSKIPPGAEVVTDSGSTLQMLVDGGNEPITLGGGREVAYTGEMSGGVQDMSEAAAQPPQGTRLRPPAGGPAVRPGTSWKTLDPTAAVAGGGGPGDDGNNFVVLARILEATTPLGWGYPNELPADPTIELLGTAVAPAAAVVEPEPEPVNLPSRIVFQNDDPRDGDGENDPWNDSGNDPNANDIAPIVVAVSEEGLQGGNPGSLGFHDSTSSRTATGTLLFVDPDGATSTHRFSFGNPAVPGSDVPSAFYTYVPGPGTPGAPADPGAPAGPLSPSAAGPLTSGGQEIHWTVIDSPTGPTLVGYLGDVAPTAVFDSESGQPLPNVVLTIGLDNTGLESSGTHYTVNLYQQIDHPYQGHAEELVGRRAVLPDPHHADRFFPGRHQYRHGAADRAHRGRLAAHLLGKQRPRAAVRRGPQSLDAAGRRLRQDRLLLRRGQRRRQGCRLRRAPESSRVGQQPDRPHLGQPGRPYPHGLRLARPRRSSSW